MKPFCYTKTIIALAVAVAAATGSVIPAQGQPAPTAPAASDSGLPADIQPGSPLADVVKMLQAGVDAATVKGYILNCQSLFNLDADKISYLKDLGASSDLINAMLDRDKALYAACVTPPAPAPAPAPIQTAAAPAPAPIQTAAAAPAPEPVAAPAADPAPDLAVAPPPTEMTADYFNTSLAPYGSWVEIDGYGRCWRPTVVVYNTAWSPYGDAGHWVYTDYGWYWDSDYAWGMTFHYGRWFRDARFGWCWYPDTVWAPSWVAWRSNDDYCGWAPLPPFAVFRPGVGFFYRGVAVGVNFDFGLAADCFVFVSPGHFCDRRPRSFFVPHERIVEVFQHTTIINHYDVHGKTVINRGFGVEKIASATHRSIEPIHVSSLSNAGQQGFRGAGFERTLHPATIQNTRVQTLGHNNLNENNNAGHNSFIKTGTGGNATLRPQTGQAIGRGGADANVSRGPGQAAVGGQTSTYHTETFQSQNQNSQSGTAGHVESAQGGRTGLQSQSGGRTFNGSSPNQNNGSSGSGETYQHGSGQLPSRQYSEPSRPTYSGNNQGSTSGNSQGQGENGYQGQGQGRGNVQGNVQGRGAANNANNSGKGNSNKQNQNQNQ